MTSPAVFHDPRTLARLERLVRLARRVAARSRRRPALRRPGRGIEPGARRAYAPGDDVRLIDWPAYARLEQLLVKVQEELPRARLDLLLDGSASMALGTPAPWVRAGLAAAALAACATAREVRTTLWWAGAPATRVDLSRPGELLRLLRFLAERTPRGPGEPVAQAIARLVDSGPGRGGAVLLTDGLDPEPLAEGAARLRRHGFDALVVVLETDAELDPAAARALDEASVAELVDAETGQRRRLPSSPALLQRAAAARCARLAELGRRLALAGVPTERLAPAAPFESVALGLLRG